MTPEQVLKQLKSLGNDGYKKMLMNNHRVEEPVYGVKIGDMKPIQKKIKRNHEMALALYDSGVYDAMYLAGLVADDEKMTKSDLNRWVKVAKGGCLSGTTVPTVAAEGRYGWEMGNKWIDSKQDHIACAGWSTLSCLVSLKEDADLDLKALKALVARVKKEIRKAPDAVRYCMNQFLICVASHVGPLSDHTLETAEKIGKIEADLGNNACQLPYAPDYVKKVKDKKGIGWKRKTVKC